LPDAAADALEGGYAISSAPVHKPDLSNRPEFELEDKSLVPGAKVPATGRYRCTACGKVRLSQSRSGKSAGAEGSAKAGEPKPSVIKPFKAGKEFPECPNCGDLTEWELVKDGG
jgi:predicted RNA-binding Zn-ribbon protein involved in translation (DUF1610 family)